MLRAALSLRLLNVTDLSSPSAARCGETKLDRGSGFTLTKLTQHSGCMCVPAVRPSPFITPPPLGWDSLPLRKRRLRLPVPPGLTVRGPHRRDSNPHNSCPSPRCCVDAMQLLQMQADNPQQRGGTQLDNVLRPLLAARAGGVDDVLQRLRPIRFSRLTGHLRLTDFAG